MERGLVKCSAQPGLVKVWKDDEEGLLKLMFEKEADQASIFIVGLTDCIITLPQSSVILMEQVDHEEWLQEFRNPRYDSPISFRDFLASYIYTHIARDGDGQAGGQSTSGDGHSSQVEVVRGISAEGRGSNMSATGGGGSEEDLGSGGLAAADDMPPQVDTTTHPMPAGDKEVKKVEIQLRIKGKPGEGISPFLYLMCNKKYCTTIESSVTLEFTQKLNEDEKLLDVNLRTNFTLPDAVVVGELKPASCDKRVGILHDDLVCSYYAQEPQSLPLIKHHAVDLSVLDTTTNSSSSSTIGYTIGAEGGVRATMAIAKVAGAFHHSFGKGKEIATSLKLDAIQGTMFVVSPFYSPDLTQETLAYIAHHHTPLKNTKLEEAGLLLDTRRKAPTMSMGKPVSMECSGHFWVMSNTTEIHVFEATRDLGEFSLLENNKKWVPKLMVGKQALKRQLLVNHGFQWELFDGRVFRRMLSSVQGQGNPIQGLIEFP